MSIIWDAIVYAYASVAIVPVIPFLLVFFWARWRGNERNQAIKLSMDVTTFFLVGCVSMLLNRLGTSFGPYILLLFILILGGLLGGAQNRARGRVDSRRLLRAVWRLTFFMTTVLYVVLTIVDISIRIVGKSA
ncbi:DUF3397 domain-containing protein [Cohnella fermenti]|uniref:DUF3397 domain-containing protein n=1 Tax=Cohnella fermenti TaxID=2565925 RepID=A0A4S4BLG1_9BACL|nr:DUF3397 domain-containing protein [Cohnella fermenti]THF75606.1 DUF3397 domain-containing protein [Cohnella fermenti]